MTDETSAPAGGDAIAVITPAPDTGADLSISQAAKALAAARHRPKEQAPVEQPAADPVEQPELAQANADPVEPAPGEEPDAIEPAEQPPIEPPRSWTKEAKDRWDALPRDAQEEIARIEQSRERDYRTRQNEIAEERKAAKAEREAADKVRQQYETQLPALMRELESVNQAQFSDVKSMEDVVRLQAEDPFRFQAWQVHQMRMQAVKQESDRAEQQKATERQSKRVSYETEQNKLLMELVPEMADTKKSVELRERAVAMLTDDLGMKRDQLERWMADDTGHEILSNAGFQKLVADGLKYRDIQKAPKAVAAKPLPPVQRPGAAKPAGNAQSEQIQALTRKLEQTGDLRVAQQLRALQSRPRRAS